MYVLLQTTVHLGYGSDCSPPSSPHRKRDASISARAPKLADYAMSREALQSEIRRLNSDFEHLQFFNKGVLQTNDEHKITIAELRKENDALRVAEHQLSEVEEKLEEKEKALAEWKVERREWAKERKMLRDEVRKERALREKAEGKLDGLRSTLMEGNFLQGYRAICTELGLGEDAEDIAGQSHAARSTLVSISGSIYVRLWSSLCNAETLKESARRSSNFHSKRQRTTPSLEPIVVVPSKRPKVNRIASDTSNEAQEPIRTHMTRTTAKRVSPSGPIVTPRKRLEENIQAAASSTRPTRRVAVTGRDDWSTFEPSGSAKRLEESIPSASSTRKAKERDVVQHQQSTSSTNSKLTARKVHQSHASTSRQIQDDMGFRVKSEPPESPESGSSEDGELPSSSVTRSQLTGTQMIH